MKAPILRLSTLLLFGLLQSSTGSMPPMMTLPARNPIRPPLFSIDLESPEVLAGSVSASDLLLPSERTDHAGDHCAGRGDDAG